MTSFKDKFDFDKRVEQAGRIKIKYPNRIPIIIEKEPSSNIQDIDKNKYLVPKDLTISQFIYIIRKRIKINAEEAIFLFINNNTLPASSELMSSIYQKYKEKDQFLYFSYSSEQTYG